ncbi:MAG: hypothetical protein KDD68_19850 [Bdellovibrionales bacterium]|nr:hypothetical protein [Bdellovibrionales bacterium]
MIKNKNDDEFLDPNAGQGRVEFDRINFYIGGQTRIFRVHSDTKVSAIKIFIYSATPQNIGIVDGPRGGRKLGVNGAPIQCLQIFVADE